MANYYVRKTGNNSSAGTSPATAWLTLAKALGALGIASGDTVYVGAGVYRETVTVTMTSPSALTRVVADTDGSHTGDAGEVRWTAYLTNDLTTPTNVACVDLNGRRYLSFDGFLFCGGGSSAHLVDASSNGACRDASFVRCCFIHQGLGGTGDCIAWKGVADVANNFTVDRCRFLQLGAHAAISVTLPPSSIALYDAVVAVTNSSLLCMGGSFAAAGVLMLSSGGIGTFYPGGVRVLGCTYVGRGAAASITASQYTTNASYACVFKDSLVVTSGTALMANGTGQLLEDYNRLVCATASSNVAAGTHSVADASHALLLHVGQELAAGMTARHYLTPTADSPLLGFGHDTTPTPPTYDLLGRPRPSGPGPTWSSAASAAGCLERHDFGVKETTTVDSSSSVSVKVAGPGDLEFLVPVDATSTTITVRVQRNGSYAGTNPQLQLLAAPELGVTAQSYIDPGAASTWNTLTLSAFTPTARGVVVLRLVSGTTSGAGVVYWDTVSVT